MEQKSNSDDKSQSNQDIRSRFIQFIKDKFNLDDDRALQSEVIENISKGVEVKGTNLWVLIFATYVASLGLNVNSAAVIIGAMLISPLMGPIMGIGLSVGVNNFELMKRSLRNFGFMVVVSIMTSTIYFTISPLSNAQSELLARTVPTTYDVLIAFFGGLAGVVAQTRKDRTSTVIPGVAIATALMPPLCTAGFGLATGQFKYFFGAFYLFFINTVFIAMATYVIVRFLKYEKKVFLDKLREQKVKRYMIIIVTVTLVPSFFIGYNLVKTSIFDTAADKYVAEVFNFENTRIADYTKSYKNSKHPSTIEILLVGEPMSRDAITMAEAQLSRYNMEDVKLVVRQANGSDDVDFTSIQKNYVQILDEKNAQIATLQNQLKGFTIDSLPYSDISREASVVFGNIKSISLTNQVWYSVDGEPIDTMLVCMIRPTVANSIDRNKLYDWLRVRTKQNSIKIYLD